ncbi:MAG: methyltransferase domain-containing protein [Bdellovibrionaceae bacterium]|jgi:ubiquinone/menaquinone biosynthesis C-methylase UbiE|nr:methyltransferase domain-containing protein [Pseudobdellovibrionaceae bacterium]
MTDLADITKNYYDSSDADIFYHEIWGGEDIHIGIYKSTDDIKVASRQTVEEMTKKIQITSKSHVLDLGSGYGGTARYLAKNYDCQVTAFNLSDVENKRHQQKNKEQKFEKNIKVVQGNFEKLSFEPESFDIVWSQDAFLHTDKKQMVLKEVYRVLKTGGSFIFTDPMQSDDCPENVLEPILERIHLKEMGSPQFYKEQCQNIGFSNVQYIDLSEQLPKHYQSVLTQIISRQEELSTKISSGYLKKMRLGLELWVKGGLSGHLAWGIFLATK